MYTQCSHCNAVFRVTMKELTAAQGLLRCGECDTIFDAMKALSTNLPDKNQLLHTAAMQTDGIEQSDPRVLSDTIRIQPTGTQQHYQTANKGSAAHNGLNTNLVRHPTPKQRRARRFMLISVVALFVLLLVQLLYSSRGWLAEQPLTAGVGKQLCNLVSCDARYQRDISQIELLSRNVYSHPNSPNLLIINASMQNNADYPQPYPLVEISFLNSASEIVALRRFTPAEYLKSNTQELMPTNTSRELSINIADPGQDAVRFQFRFL